MYINIHSVIKSSRVNGPGDRFVIWTQGCRKGCKNCYNPETWSHYKNNLITIEEIIEEIKNSSATGVTISGGDPFEQPEELFYLLREIKQLSLSDGLKRGLSATLKISQQILKLNIKFSRNILYSVYVQIIPSFRVTKFEPIF